MYDKYERQNEVSVVEPLVTCVPDTIFPANISSGKDLKEIRP